MLPSLTPSELLPYFFGDKPQQQYLEFVVDHFRSSTKIMLLKGSAESSCSKEIYPRGRFLSRDAAGRM